MSDWPFLQEFQTVQYISTLIIAHQNIPGIPCTLWGKTYHAKEHTDESVFMEVIDSSEKCHIQLQ